MFSAIITVRLIDSPIDPCIDPLDLCCVFLFIDFPLFRLHGKEKGELSLFGANWNRCSVFYACGSRFPSQTGRRACAAHSCLPACLSASSGYRRTARAAATDRDCHTPRADPPPNTSPLGGKYFTCTPTVCAIPPRFSASLMRLIRLRVASKTRLNCVHLLCDLISR